MSELHNEKIELQGKSAYVKVKKKRYSTSFMGLIVSTLTSVTCHKLELCFEIFIQKQNSHFYIIHLILKQIILSKSINMN